MLNRCAFIGNLGRDPERRTAGTASNVSFSLAVTERWKDRDGGRQERTEWVNVVIWNEKLAGIAEQYLRKGSRCYIEGQMQTRKWTDKSGQERYTTEIVLQRFNGTLVLLGDKGEGSANAQSAKPAKSLDDELDDEIPF